MCLLIFSNRGLSPAEAELKFLEIARRLELYGSEVFKAKVRVNISLLSTIKYSVG